jgi:hypothetical protein
LVLLAWQQLGECLHVQHFLHFFWLRHYSNTIMRVSIAGITSQGPVLLDHLLLHSMVTVAAGHHARWQKQQGCGVTGWSG